MDTFSYVYATHIHSHVHTTNKFRGKKGGHSPLPAVSKIQKTQCIDI